MKKQTKKTGDLALICLLADIREAVGDPKGKLMQDELVEHCRKLHHENATMKAWIINVCKLLEKAGKEDDK